MQRIKYLAVFVVLLMAGCRDKDLDMTVLNKSLFDGADFTEIVLNDSWNVTIVQDDEKTGIDLEYSAFLEDYLDVKQEKKNLSIAFTHRLNLPYNTVMNAVIHPSVPIAVQGRVRRWCLPDGWPAYGCRRGWWHDAPVSAD